MKHLKRLGRGLALFGTVAFLMYFAYHMTTALVVIAILVGCYSLGKAGEDWR